MLDVVRAHLLFMQTTIQNFEQTCTREALKDDVITPEERRQLNAIKRANARYLRALSKVR